MKNSHVVETMKEMNLFQKIKYAYEEAREEQRRAIISYLNENGYCNHKGSAISFAGGCGRGIRMPQFPWYTSNGRIKEFDLSNWKYIEAQDKEGFYYFITLQPHEWASENYCHVLYDRIGVYVGEIKKESEEIYKNLLITDIDLPISQESLKALIDILKNEKTKIQQGK